MSVIKKRELKKPLVSIIVPVYNYEEYLPKCLDSLVNQTYENIEIILIDDGSTDKSGEICDAYAERDARIAVYHKENGGIGSAYKMAFDKCTGDYIAFVDSDDYVDLKSYEKQINVAIETDADIVESGEYILGLNGELRHIVQLKKEEIVGNEAIMIDYLVKNTLTPLGMKFCKAELYKMIEIPSVSVGIDEIISIQVMLKAQKVVKMEEGFYYVLGEPGKDSVSRRAIDGKNLAQQIQLHNDILKIISLNNREYVPYYIVRFLRFLRGMYVHRCDDNNEQSEVILKEYIKQIKQVDLKKLRSFYGNLMLGSLKVFAVCPRVYRWLCRHRKTELDN